MLCCAVCALLHAPATARPLSLRPVQLSIDRRFSGVFKAFTTGEESKALQTWGSFGVGNVTGRGHVSARHLCFGFVPFPSIQNPESLCIKRSLPKLSIKAVYMRGAHIPNSCLWFYLAFCCLLCCLAAGLPDKHLGMSRQDPRGCACLHRQLDRRAGRQAAKQALNPKPQP